MVRGPLDWHYLTTKFHENLPSGSKGIHTSFILKATDSVKDFFPHSTQLSLVSMVTSQPLLSFLYYSKFHALVAIVTSAKDCA
jgi:hypothetical protein